MIKTNIQVGWNMKIMQDLNNSNTAVAFAVAAATRQKPIQRDERKKHEESSEQKMIIVLSAIVMWKRKSHDDDDDVDQLNGNWFKKWCWFNHFTVKW